MNADRILEVWRGVVAPRTSWAIGTGYTRAVVEPLTVPTDPTVRPAPGPDRRSERRGGRTRPAEFTAESPGLDALPGPHHL